MTVGDLKSRLDTDKAALMNMKRDLGESHENEINKLREELFRVKWEYDHIRVENNSKEKKLLDLAGGVVRYMGVGEAEVETTASAEEVKKISQKTLADAEDDLAAEHRTQKMLNVMSYCLDEETNEIRAEGAQIEQSLETCKFEYTNVDGLLRLSKSELLEQEAILDDLNMILNQRLAVSREQKVCNGDFKWVHSCTLSSTLATLPFPSSPYSLPTTTSLALPSPALPFPSTPLTTY